MFKFGRAKTNINPNDLDNYDETLQKINKAGFKLRTIINNLNDKRKSNPTSVIYSIFWLLLVQLLR